MSDFIAFARGLCELFRTILLALILLVLAYSSCVQTAAVTSPQPQSTRVAR